MLLLQIGLVVLSLVHSLNAYQYNEELLVENLPGSHALLHFEFSSFWQNGQTNPQVKNYDLFPKSLGDIVSKFKLDELRLSLSQGTWKHDKWGMPAVSAPSGSELWGLFQNDLPKNLVDEFWIQSSRTLSGLFGLSINLNETPNTVRPKYLNLISGNRTSVNVENLRYVSVPNEIVCTENFTPWLKMLPCGRNKGIAELFKNVQKLFESQYLLVDLNFKQTCLDANCLTKKSQLKQTLTLVYNIDLLKTRRTDKELVWSFENVFSNKIRSNCPVADSTSVYLDLGRDVASTLPFKKKVKYSSEKNIFVFDLNEHFQTSADFNPAIITKKEEEALSNQLISTHRFLTNSNEKSFGIKTILHNVHDKKLTIVYFDTIPWFFRVYISSLKIEKKDGTSIKPDKLHFTPGLDRQQPNHLEIVFTLEPQTLYSIYFKVEYAYLKWDEFPPDTNHGFHINPGMISISLPINEHRNTQLRSFNLYSSISDILSSKVIEDVKLKVVNVYTETLLMNLPVPDFSMPYNVICLTCTVIAIAFGSLHNFTTRKFVFMEPKTLKEKAIGGIKRIFGKNQ